MRAYPQAIMKSAFALVIVGAILAVLLSSSRVSARPSGDATYLGQKHCRTCHYKEYKIWQKGRHAKAWQALSEEERVRPECFPCHVTGHDRQWGYVSEEKTPHLTGVQCESCHGPGGAHAEAARNEESAETLRALVSRVGDNACVECHNPHQNPKGQQSPAGSGHSTGGSAPHDTDQ